MGRMMRNMKLVFSNNVSGEERLPTSTPLNRTHFLERSSNNIEMDLKIVTKEQASFTELLENEEGIILDLQSLRYYTLNAAAIYLWKQIRTGSAVAFDELTASLAASFRISAEEAEADVRSYLSALESQGLIWYSEGPAPAYGMELDPAVGGLPEYEPPQLQLSNSLTLASTTDDSSASVVEMASAA
jgi:hypothetical protein